MRMTQSIIVVFFMLSGAYAKDPTMKFFNRLDANNDGVATQAEWLAGTEAVAQEEGRPFVPEKAVRNMSMRDVNGDGKVTAEEYGATVGKKSEKTKSLKKDNSKIVASKMVG